MLQIRRNISQSDGSDRAAQLAAFEAQIGSCRSVAFAYALAFLRSPVAAEDAVQEALVQAFSMRHTLKNQTKFEPWVMQIVRNKCRDAHRRQRIRITEPLGENLIASERLPEAELIQREEHERLQAAIARLPEKQRLPLRLFYDARLTYQQIADALGVPHSTVVGRLAQGLRVLRREISKEEKE
jgi:RNA polymerase sigma-70 factor, ECF subfamily